MSIDEGRWKDQALRELAKSYTLNGAPNKAIKLISYINNADTKALTIRGIGMNYAKISQDISRLDALFEELKSVADTIEHKPSKEIAYTYIGMAQSYANMDKEAVSTALSMQNPALKNKALGEIAEIQAEQNKYKLSFDTLALIEDVSFKNKAYRIISKIYAQNGSYKASYDAAILNLNLTSRAESLQALINAQEKEALQ